MVLLCVNGRQSEAGLASGEGSRTLRQRMLGATICGRFDGMITRALSGQYDLETFP